MMLAEDRKWFPANECIVTSWCMWLYCDDHNVNAAQCCENRVIIISSQILSNNDADDNLSDQQLSIFTAATAFKVIFNNMCPNHNISPPPIPVYRKVKTKLRFFKVSFAYLSESMLVANKAKLCSRILLMCSNCKTAFVTLNICDNLSWAEPEEF